MNYYYFATGQLSTNKFGKLKSSGLNEAIVEVKKIMKSRFDDLDLPVTSLEIICTEFPVILPVNDWWDEWNKEQNRLDEIEEQKERKALYEELKKEFEGK